MPRPLKFLVSHVSRNWSRLRRAYFSLRNKDYDAFVEAGHHLNTRSPQLVASRSAVRALARNLLFSTPRFSKLLARQQRLVEEIGAIESQLPRLRDTLIHDRKTSRLTLLQTKMHTTKAVLEELERDHLPQYWAQASRTEAARLALARLGYSFGPRGKIPHPGEMDRVMEHIPIPGKYSSRHSEKGRDAAVRRDALKQLIPILGPLRARLFYRNYCRFYYNLMHDYFTH